LFATIVAFLGILLWNALQRPSVGTAKNLVILQAIVQMKVFAIHVGRQDTLQETARLLVYLLET